MLNLPTVTLVSLAAVNYEGTLDAITKSMESIEFASVKMITPTTPAALPNGVTWNECTPLRLRAPGIDDYSHYCLYDLWRHVETAHCLVIQADGYVINPDQWDPGFLEYDYIGAPWPIRKNSYIDPFGVPQRVGNGGFSLRSKKLLELPQKVDVPWQVNASDFYNHMGANLLNEDGNICVHNRHIFEANGCRFAPVEVAVRFSQEHKIPEARGVTPFGFHRYKPDARKRRLFTKF